MNLATRLLVDGFNKDYEKAVIVSNDADFASAMKYVRDDLGRFVALVNPDPKKDSPKELAGAATYIKHLWKKHLKLCQFPNKLQDDVGTITKPPGW